MSNENEFFQESPVLKNQFEDDLILKNTLNNIVPLDILKKFEPHLRQMGNDVATTVFNLATEAELESNKPQLIAYNPYGKRIDQIKMCQAWDDITAYAAENGLIAAGYERKYGEYSRVYQMSMLYLFHPSSAFVSCPMAMTDGAAKLIETYGDEKLKKTFNDHLMSRDKKSFWTSGQWMTERTGGSDVSGTTTIASTENGIHKLNGTKWFTSATTSQMAFTLAYPEGIEKNSRSLSLYYLETGVDKGSLNNIEVLRLKDKLGTRAMPTAELKLVGTPAYLVGGEGNGVKKISTLFNVTRIYNSVCSVAQMRRAIALASDYSTKRFAFKKNVADHVLFKEVMSDALVELEGSVSFIMHIAHLLGKEETNKATPNEEALLRLLTPLAKLFTGKLSVKVVSEMVEVFAGAGYIEDTGIPKLLRDAQVFPIWEGATNVLSLDVLRALSKECPVENFFEDMIKRVEKLTDDSLKKEFLQNVSELQKKFKNIEDLVTKNDHDSMEASARNLSFLMARIYIASLLVESALKSTSPRSKVVAKRWMGKIKFHEIVDRDRRNETDLILKF
jgi:putative acyl-CoA dehydrogenase